MGDMFVYQPALLFYSLVLGLALGVLYDVFRLINCLFNSKPNKTFVIDIIFLSVCSILTFIFILSVNFGIIRFHILFGELLGFFCYYLTVGRFVYRFILFFTSRLRFSKRYIKKKVALPVKDKTKIIIKKSAKNLSKNVKKVKNIHLIRKKLVTKRKKY